MINLKKYIQILITDFVLEYIKITDDTVYVDAYIYPKLRKKIDKSTIDSIMYEITGKEYAGYFTMTDGKVKRYKWDSEKKLYSQRGYIDSLLTPGAG
jgi:hypothetical protein